MSAALALPWLDAASSPSVPVGNAQEKAARALTFVTPMLIGMLAWEICTQDVASTLGALSRRWRQRPRRRRRSGSIDSISSSSSSTHQAKLIPSSGLLDARWHTRVVRTVVRVTSFAARAAAACMLGVASNYMHGRHGGDVCMSAAWPRAVVAMGAVATSLITLAVICNALLVVCDGGPRNMRLFAIVAATWAVQVVLAYTSLAFVAFVDNGGEGCPSLRFANTFGLFYVGALLHLALLPVLLITRPKQSEESMTAQAKQTSGHSIARIAPSWRPGLESTLKDQSTTYDADANHRPPFQRWPLVLNAISPLTAHPATSDEEQSLRCSQANAQRQTERKSLILDDEDVFQAVRRAHFEHGLPGSASDAVRIEALAAVCVWVRNDSSGSTTATSDIAAPPPSCLLRFDTTMAPFTLWWLSAILTMIGGAVISFLDCSSSQTFLCFLLTSVLFVLFCQRLTTPASRRILLDVVDGRGAGAARAAPPPSMSLNSPQGVMTGTAEDARMMRASVMINQRRMNQTTSTDEHGHSSFLPGVKARDKVATLRSFATRNVQPSTSCPAHGDASTGFREVKSDVSIRAKILSLVRNFDSGASVASRKAATHNSGSSRSRSARISPSIKHVSAGTMNADQSSASGREAASSIDLDRAMATLQSLPVAMIGRDAESMPRAVTPPTPRIARDGRPPQPSKRDSSLGTALERIEIEMNSSQSTTEPSSSDYVGAQPLSPSSLQPRRKRAASKSGGKGSGTLRDYSNAVGKQDALTRLSSHGSLERVDRIEEAATEHTDAPTGAVSMASHGGSEAGGVTGAFFEYYNSQTSEDTHSTSVGGHRASMSVPAVPPIPPASTWQEAGAAMRARPLSGGHVLTTTVDSFGVSHSARINASRRTGGADAGNSGSWSPKTTSASTLSDNSSMHQRVQSLQVVMPAAAAATAEQHSSPPVGTTFDTTHGTRTSSVASFHSAAEMAAARNPTRRPDSLSADAVLETMLSYDGAPLRGGGGGGGGGGGKMKTFSMLRSKHDNGGDDEVTDATDQSDNFFFNATAQKGSTQRQSQNYDLPSPQMRCDDANSFKRDDDVSSISSEVERKHQEALQAGIEEADEDLLFQFIDPRGFHKDEGSAANSATGGSMSGSQSHRRASMVKRQAMTSVDDAASSSRGTDAWERKTESSFGLGDISANPRLRSRQGSTTSKCRSSSKASSFGGNGGDSIAVQAANAVVQAAPHRQVRKKKTVPALMTAAATETSPASSNGGLSDSYFDPLAATGATLNKTPREELRPKRSSSRLIIVAASQDDSRMHPVVTKPSALDAEARTSSGVGERGGIEVLDTTRSGITVSGGAEDGFHSADRDAAEQAALTSRHVKRNGRPMPRFPSYESNLARERLNEDEDDYDDGRDKGKRRAADDDKGELSRRFSVGREVARLETVDDDSSVFSHRSNEKETGSSSQGVRKNPSAV